MGLKLGEVHEGWAPVSDVRYLDAGIVWVAFQFVLVIVFSLLLSPDPGAVLLHPAMFAVLGIMFFVLLFAGWVSYRRHADGEQTTFVRNFRVEDPEVVWRTVGKRLPRKFYPLNRFSEDAASLHTSEGETVRKVTLALRELEGVKNRVELLVKVDRHLVEARVVTSDRDSMATRDLLDALDDYLSRHRMDWLSVDVDEDALLLVAMGQKERRNPVWDASITRDGLERTMMFIFVVMGAFWLPLAWAILHPEPGWVINLAVLGILLKPLLVATFLLVLAEFSRRVEQEVECEHSRQFHASPWYVTAAIQEGLDRARRSYRTRTRVDPTDHVRSECFELQDCSVTIDVAWADRDTDPNWTTVHIRTPSQGADLQSVQDLVRTSVFGRHRELGI